VKKNGVKTPDAGLYLPMYFYMARDANVAVKNFSEMKTPHFRSSTSLLTGPLKSHCFINIFAASNS